MQIKARIVVVAIFVFSLIIEFLGLMGAIMTTTWQSLPLWEKMVFTFGVLVEFCGALLAFWPTRTERKSMSYGRLCFRGTKAKKSSVRSLLLAFSEDHHTFRCAIGVKLTSTGSLSIRNS
jgi:hypothetical protein